MGDPKHMISDLTCWQYKVKHSCLLQDHWQAAADHLLWQFKELLQKQQQQQACMEAFGDDSAAPSPYPPEQLQQAEQIWHDLQASQMHASSPGLCIWFSACFNVMCTCALLVLGVSQVQCMASTALQQLAPMMGQLDYMNV